MAVIIPSGDRGWVGGDRAIGPYGNGDRGYPPYYIYGTSSGGAGGGGGGLVDGDPVSSWADSSTGGNAATASGTTRPVFKTNIVNGKPVVRFDGVDDTMAFSGSALGLFNNVAGGTLFVVFSDSAGGDVSHTVFGWAQGATVSSRAVILVTGGNFVSRARRLDADTFVDSAATASAGFHVVSGVYNWSGNTNTLFKDGTTATPIAFSSGAGNTSATNSNNAVIGSATTAQHAFGDVAEAIVYNVALSATDRANIEKYLGTKYAITVAAGSAVQPDTVTGLQGWWKADSLL